MLSCLFFSLPDVAVSAAAFSSRHDAAAPCLLLAQLIAHVATPRALCRLMMPLLMLLFDALRPMLFH